MEDQVITKIGVGKNAGMSIRLDLKAVNDVYEVYSDGTFIGKTRLDDGLWTVEIPVFASVCYYALAARLAADLLDLVYRINNV